MRQIQHFIVNENITGNEVKIFDNDLIHQIKNVLRLRVGDPLIVLDGKGQKAEAEILEIDKKSANLSLKNHEKFERARHKIRLYSALSKKPSTFELILQKATELGVDEIIPLITERTQVEDVKKNERLNLIVKEATEQSERIFMPELKASVIFPEFIVHPPSGLILAGDPWQFDGELKELKSKNVDLNIVIGPEGGLTNKELEQIRDIGGKIFQLGKSVLRMETAAIASLAVVLYG